MSFSKRLRAVLKEEGATQREFASEIGMALRSIEEYINDRNKPSGELFMNIGSSAKYKKYTMWLLTGDTEANSGQICPAFSIQEQCGLVDEASRKQA